MSVHYSEEFKKDVVKAYMDGDRPIVQIAADYNVAKSTVSEWVKKYGEECQYKKNTTKTNESESAKEIRRLNKLLHEKDKEIDFLKKAAEFFAKEID